MPIRMEVTECQRWLGLFPMTGRSVLQNRDIDLKAKRIPADGFGNGIADAGLRCLKLPHHLAVKVDIQPRCGNSRLESRMRENRTCGSEGGEGESLSLPLSELKE